MFALEFVNKQWSESAFCIYRNEYNEQSNKRSRDFNSVANLIY